MVKRRTLTACWNSVGLPGVNHEICSAAFPAEFVGSLERSMNTLMLLTFVLIFLLGIVTGSWLTAITVRSR